MVYVISKPGKTGCSAAALDEVAPRMDEVRRAAGDVPTTIGFGVATPEHVRAFAPLAVRAPHHRPYFRGRTRRGDAPVDTSIHLSKQGSSK